MISSATPTPRRPRGRRPGFHPPTILFPRDIAVLRLVAAGAKTGQIAERLGLTYEQASCSRQRAVAKMAKLGREITVSCVDELAADLPVCGPEDYVRLVPSTVDRIKADIRAGLRCPACWITSPCADHESARYDREKAA